ncbi:MAG: KUP/HAK/KT family potassium transporter [Syntrophobacteraceae bacterium]|nr:KUP/HAK/KT family potassium transporter [Syntrophobacteraceae bacterium]
MRSFSRPDETCPDAPVLATNPGSTGKVNAGDTVSSHCTHGIGTLPLALGALGIVYGDIGTSPLYAIKECFHGLHAITPSALNILGVLSLVFWSLTMVVTVKYVAFILRADNKGEGGIYALLALIPADKTKQLPRMYAAIVLAGMLGAALLYGDGIITPAISVLSAMEGLEVATRAAAPFVLPLTCLVLFVLFSVQRRGTSDIGKVFGPAMLVWFATIGALGILEIMENPHILSAVNPVYAVKFFIVNKVHGMIVLGSVVLCITGGEALYADLGHFGRDAIRLSWLTVACPSLLLNYFGQGALLLGHPGLVFNPFYGLVPHAFLYPMVLLSTMATVIASQAMITGVFSLTQQAVQMGFFPRVHVVHTSAQTQGQIFIEKINFALMAACIGLVLVFRESSRLAGAYGIAVTATMGITSILYFFVATRVWKWPLWKALPIVAVFLAFDISYFGANLLKILDGGWFTLAIALAITIAMATWRDGRAELSHKMLSAGLPMQIFLDDIESHNPVRVPGTAVFMTVSPVGVPSALLHHLRHNHVLHEKVIILSIRSADVPTVPAAERIKLQELGQGFHRVLAFYGFMETPDVPDIMQRASSMGLHTELYDTTFFLGRETLLTTGSSQMSHWRKSLFTFMSRNAQTPMTYFGLPPNRVVEIGVQVEL